MEEAMETTERTEMPEGEPMLPMMYHLMASYEKRCQPLCKQFDLPQTAVDILMFLANHPGCRTASEVSRYRRIQPSLVFGTDSGGRFQKKDLSGVYCCGRAADPGRS